MEKTTRLKRYLKSVPKDTIIDYLAEKFLFQTAEDIALPILSKDFQTKSNVFEIKIGDNIDENKNLQSELSSAFQRGDTTEYLSVLSRLAKNEKEYDSLNKKWSSLYETHSRFLEGKQ